MCNWGGKKGGGGGGGREGGGKELLSRKARSELVGVSLCLYFLMVATHLRNCAADPPGRIWPHRNVELRGGNPRAESAPPPTHFFCPLGW